MSGVLAPQWLLQALTDAGAVASGAKLFSYIAGSGDVPTPVYADEALTTQLSNPYTFDSAGRGQFWLDEAISYRLRLETATGVLLAERDGVDGIASARDYVKKVDLTNDSDPSKGAGLLGWVGQTVGHWIDLFRMFITDLANSADALRGAALVGYEGRTVADRLSESMTLRDFGAVGDGVADDTQAIQAALDLGGTVHITHGVYLYSQVSANVAGLTLVGAGGTLRLLNASNVETSFAVSANDVTLDSVVFDGGGDAPGKAFSARVMVAFGGVKNPKALNCIFRNHKCSREIAYTCALLIDPDSCDGFTVEGCTFDDIAHETFSLTNGTGFVEGLYFYNPLKTRQDQIQYPSNGSVRGCIFRDIYTISSGGAGILTVADSDCLRFFVSDPSDLTTPLTPNFTASFSDDLASGDVVSSAIEGVAVPSVAFVTDHETTMLAWKAAIEGAYPGCTATPSGRAMTVSNASLSFVRGNVSLQAGATTKISITQNRVYWGISITDCTFVRPQKRPIKLSGSHGLSISGATVIGNAPGQFCATMFDVRQSVGVSITDSSVVAWGYSVAELHGKNLVMSGVRYRKPALPEPTLTPLTPVRAGSGLRFGIVRLYDKAFSDSDQTKYTTDNVVIDNVDASDCGSLIYVDGSTTGAATASMDSTANYLAAGIKPLNNITVRNCRAFRCGSNRIYQTNGFTAKNVQIDGDGTESAWYLYDALGVSVFSGLSIKTARYAIWADLTCEKIAIENVDIEVSSWLPSVNNAVIYIGSSGSANISEASVSGVRLRIPTYNSSDLSPTTNAPRIWRVNRTAVVRIADVVAVWTGNKTLANMTSMGLVQAAESVSVRGFSVEYLDATNIAQTPHIISILGTVGRVDVLGGGHRYWGIQIQAATTVARLSANGTISIDGIQLKTNSGTLTSDQATAVGITW